MDPIVPIDDQFSKLHPCMPVDTRIRIVGAGPSGIFAAYALAKLGYRNVTVFEKHHTVAGMCESVNIEGKIYDLGGQVLAKNSAPVIFHLAKEAEMKEGFYDRVEKELQGANNTYYVGGLMAFELTERNSSYAMALMCKHFANNDFVPMFPYIKSLFSLQSGCWNKDSKELGESPGVESPNLSSLDGYLKHWGTHEATKSKTLLKILPKNSG